MYLIVGLGNPGSRYEITRHNIGFMVADFLAERHKLLFKRDTDNYAYFQYSLTGEGICILKPLMYMNRSGEAVCRAMQRWNIDESRLLAVYDDFNLPFGKLRLRASGSDGGHNGMASLIYSLRSEKFMRMRIGIRNDDLQKDAVRFVLSAFNPEEERLLPKLIEEAANAVESVVVDGIVKTMNSYNRNVLDM